MQKRIVSVPGREVAGSERPWLDLESLAQVEVSAEDPAYPIEAALIGSSESGWRADTPGRQTIRILFDEPQRISQIALLFREEEQERTQEFVLRCALQGSAAYQEIVRQQYNFNPSGATIEHEKYDVDLDGVTSVELMIIPDISSGLAKATLEKFKIAP